MSWIIRPKQTSDNESVSKLIQQTWHTTEIITRGRVYPVIDLEGFIAEQANQILGLIQYRLNVNECEVVVLQSMAENQGIGTRLLHTVIDAARESGCKRVWLITTNDNIHALRFYQKRGFTFSAIYCNAMEVSRKIKPQIPLIGHDGIPMRDEIEFEFVLV